MDREERALATTVTVKGQITIPKRIRDAKGFKPGSKVVFDINEAGETVIRPAGRPTPPGPIHLDRVIGSAQIKWQGTTDEYMELIRGYSDDPR
jgi:AbrB family looped-hinge helix DNA binding protein